MFNLVGNAVSELGYGSYPSSVDMYPDVGLVLLGLAVLFLVAIGIYIYSSFAFMAIGRKAKINTPALAWIPGVGSLLVAYYSDKRNKSGPWWFLLWGLIPYILGAIFIGLGVLSPALMILGVLFMVAAVGCWLYFGVMTYIWTWRMFEAIKRPGWWAIIPALALPFLILLILPGGETVYNIINYAASLWFLIMVGIAAWGEPN